METTSIPGGYHSFLRVPDNIDTTQSYGDFSMPEDGDIEGWISGMLEKYGFSLDENGNLTGNFDNAGEAGQGIFEGLDSFYQQGEGGFNLESLIEKLMEALEAAGISLEEYLGDINGQLEDMNGPPRPTGPTGRPEGDNRSAEEIIEDSPALANLGDQKDIQIDKLKERCGDWTEDNPDPESRADAAYNMSQVLEYIDSCKNREGGYRGPGDGNIEGITDDGDARRGTEAGMLKDFGDQGYSALPENHQLDQTDDPYVELDGSNKDNFEKFMDDVGEFLGPLLEIFSFIPGVNLLSEGIDSFGSDGVFSTSNNNIYGNNTPITAY